MARSISAQRLEQNGRSFGSRGRPQIGQAPPSDGCDIESFAATQRQILATAFELLRPGGRLIYCTCSVMPVENEGVVSTFLNANPRAASAPWPEGLARPPGLLDRTVGWQLLPGGRAGTDGFYYACLTKLS